MYQTSQNFITELNKTSRRFRARITAGNDVLTEVIKTMIFTMGSCGADAFTIGSVFASYVDITLSATEVSLAGKELLIEIGLLLPDETVEYVPMGYYSVLPSGITKSRDQIVVKGTDRISRCGGLYTPSVAFPAKIQAVLDDISTKTGIIIETDLDTSGTIEKSMDNLLYREALGYIAGLLGGFCYVDRNGKIKIAAFHSTASVEVEAERHISDIQVSETNYTVGSLIVSVTEGGEDADGNEVAGVSYTAGTGDGITVSNPYMTENLFASMKNRVLDYSFRPGTVSFLGDPRLGPEDAVASMNHAGESFLFPCMSLIHDYDGGLTTTISTPGLASSDSSTQGPLSKQVERLATEMVLAKEVIAKKITADEANLKYAQIDLANIEAGCITTAMLGTGVVGTAQIADGSITDAKIVELTANKITAGTLSVERLEIRGSTSSIVYGLNNITGALQAQNVDTLNGEILTPRTITADKIVANSITGNEIAAKTITANNIVGGSITGAEIAAGTIKAINIDVANLFAQDITAKGTIRGVNLVGATGSFSGMIKSTNADGTVSATIKNGSISLITGAESYCEISGQGIRFPSAQGSSYSYMDIFGQEGIIIREGGIQCAGDLTVGGIIGNVISGQYADGYWGMGSPDKNYSAWIRTTSSGLIPYRSGGASSLGTASWPFNYVYAVNVNSTGTIIATTLQAGGSGTNGGLELYHATPFIDFHYGRSTDDYTHRIIADDANRLRVTSAFYVNGRFSAGEHILLTTHGRALCGTCSGGSTEWIAGIETRASGTSSAAVNSVRIGQNTLRTYVYTASSVYSNGAWNNFSDRRLKEEFTKLDKRYLDMFDNLNPTLFLWKDKRDTRKQAGYVAQEVLAAMNAAGISESENTIVNKTWEYHDIDNKEAGGMEIYSLEYEGIDTITAYALQDTRTTVKQHTTDIDDLKKKYTEALTRIALLEAQNQIQQQQINQLQGAA